MSDSPESDIRAVWDQQGRMVALQAGTCSFAVEACNGCRCSAVLVSLLLLALLSQLAINFPFCASLLMIHRCIAMLYMSIDTSAMFFRHYGLFETCLKRSECQRLQDVNRLTRHADKRYCAQRFSNRFDDSRTGLISCMSRTEKFRQRESEIHLLYHLIGQGCPVNSGQKGIGK